MIKGTKKKILLPVGPASNFFFSPAVNYFVKQGKKARIFKMFHKLAYSFVRMKFLKAKKRHPNRQLSFVWTKLEDGLRAVRPLVYFIHKRIKRRYRKVPKTMPLHRQRKFIWLTLAAAFKKSNRKLPIFLAREINLLYIHSKLSVVARKQQQIHELAQTLMPWLRGRKLPYFDVKKFFAKKQKKIRRTLLVKDARRMRRELKLKKISIRLAKEIMRRRVNKLIAKRKAKIAAEKKIPWWKRKQRYWIPPMDLFFQRLRLYYERRKAKIPIKRFEKRVKSRWKSLVSVKAKRKKLFRLINIVNKLNAN